MRLPRRTPLTVLAALAALLLTGLVFALPARAADADVRINEFSSNNPDFIELINIGGSPVDLSGWVLKDNSDNNSYTFGSGASIAAGARLALDGEDVDFHFGLGNGDSVRLFNSGGTAIDSYDYPSHPPAGNSYSRCPEGTGSFVTTGTVTKGAANDCGTPPAVKINEFSSNNPDFIELINTTALDVDLAGWVLKDNSENNSYTFGPGAGIAAGARLALDGEDVDFHFGLGNGDSVRLFAPGSVLVDSYDYPGHPPAGFSYSRCPEGTGDFVTTGTATKGAVNDCPAPPAGVKINEFSSNNPDFIELINVGGSAVDLSGWMLKDNTENNSYTFGSGASIAAGARLGLSGEGVDFVFGLGNGDSVRLFAPGSVLVDSYDYPGHPPAGFSYSRCPEGTGDFVTTGTATKGAENDCGAPTPPDVVVNEVESNGDKVADWVELKNRGAAPVDVSGWKIVDGDAAHAATPVVVPANTVIPAGGYYAIYTEIAQSPGFGLGVGDSVNLYLPDGSTLIDSTTWGAHPATTWGRCPDGTGEFGETTTATRGLPNACSPIRINEIESSDGDPDDWIELTNISDAPVDLAGWVLKDSGDGDAYTFSSGRTVPAHGYLVLDKTADFAFGLGSGDSVRLFDGGAELIDSYSWTAHATQTYGRCKDSIGDFTDTKAPTKGTANSCPGLDTEPWPGPQTVETADLVDTFIQDLSGLAFDPADPDVLWGAQNKLGTLYKLVRDGSNWVPAAGWPKDPVYTDGTGAPDTEGLTIGPDGFVYMASERNNNASGVSRMSILRYDPAAAGATITATDEWNLTGLIPAAGANLGLEGVTWIPDAFLTDGGFVDESTGQPYDPAGYPAHGTGLFAVGVEDTGDLILFALDSDGVTAHKIATVDSGFEHVADVTFDPERARLWAVTDDTHDGKTSQLKLDENGAFVVDTAFDRPAGMPNINNEGLALAPQSRCVDGLKEVLWSDDGDTDGHSLRRGYLECTPIPVTDPTITAVISSAVPVNAVGWYRRPVRVSFVCAEGTAPLTEPCPSPVVLRADGAGQSLARSIAATDGGTADVTVSGINIDKTRPKAAIKGVRPGSVHLGLFAPRPRCVASDATSGIASCAVTIRRKGLLRRVAIATATDVAGNTRTVRVRYFVISLFG